MTIRSLVTGYGKRQVLNGVNLDAAAGEIVALIGHNGAGKSTLLKAAFGLLSAWQGAILYDGKSIDGVATRDLLRVGLAYVAQGNRVFADLTVRENLEMGGVILRDMRVVNAGIERSLGLFPLLRARLKQQAGALSGGEKQMLALAIAFVLSPRLILLDEPSLGLSPRLTVEAFEHLRRLNKESGVTLVIVEQKVREVLDLCDRVYCLKTGSVTFAGAPDELKGSLDRLREVFL